MIKTISATSLNLYNQCPLAWKYKYIYKLLEPDNPAFIVGTAYHKALEMYYSGKQKQTIIDYLKKELIVKKTKEEINRYSLVVKMFEKYISHPLDGETIDVEYKFSYSLKDLLNDNVNLIGFIDRLTNNTIIDYKTSSFDYEQKDIESNIQTDIYSYVIWKEKGEMPYITYHIMNKKKVDKKDYKPQILTLKRTPEDMIVLENKIKEFYSNIQQGNFECKKGNYCYWCPFREYCKCNEKK